MLFIHTADLQIGRPFARVSDHTKRTCLQLARLNVIDKIAALVEKNGAKFVLVAGDFFDSPTVSQNTISSALSKLGKLGVPVYLIPGNHDHGGPGSLWEKDFLRQEMANLAPNLTLLLEKRPYETEFATIYPCPLLSKQDSESPTKWLSDEPSLNDSTRDASAMPRILLAHGTVQGFGSEGTGVANHLRLDQIPEDMFDYIALGDWHGTTKISDKAWYSGTPEVDRFQKGDDYNPGNSLVVKITAGGAPKVESVATSQLSWHDVSYTFSQDSDLVGLEKTLSESLQTRTNNDLLKLTLDGTLGLAASEKLEALLDTYEARLLRIKRFITISIAPTDSEIASLAKRTDDPVISRVAGKLIERLNTNDPEEREIVTIALRELYSKVEIGTTSQEASEPPEIEEPVEMEFGELFDFDSAA